MIRPRKNACFHLLQFLFSVDLSAELRLRVRFAYDGQSVLQFNYSRERFEALTEAALPLVRQFNRDPARLQRYRRHKEYAIFLTNTIVKVTRELTAQPSVSISTHRTARSSEPVRLNCHVIGFYPRDIDVRWLLNDAALQGPVLTSIVLPNVDGTFQLTGHIDVHPRNGDIYTCQVGHTSSPNKLTAVWAPKTNVWPSGGYVIGIVSGIVGIVCTAIGAAIRWRGHRARVTHPRPGQTGGDVRSEASSGITDSGTWTQTEADHLREAEDPNPSPSPSEDAHVRLSLG
ncbi:class II histocompatibility antigen, B-L beta chain-like [Hemiscyllium ocellatum]|uniref:class II histocompatibility antigen, B-L beta chain-like n=1 Tax=Hemiscyllium ocellatum TaxID=170820 RepID=UPI002966FA04|nr:class II histocompatibility antigen, B-L beta chain-like [Hemiscyllium ocellatum]